MELKKDSNYYLDLAKVFRALGSSIRIRMLFLLVDQDYCACQFPELLGISQPNSSRNLDVLRKAGLVVSHRDGQKIIYQLKSKSIIQLMDICQKFTDEK